MYLLDRSRYTEAMMLEGIGPTDVRKVHTLSDPGMDVSVRGDVQKDFESV